MKYLPLLMLDAALIRFGGLTMTQCYIILGLAIVAAVGFATEIQNERC